jgi:hypothetical protein
MDEMELSNFGKSQQQQQPMIMQLEQNSQARQSGT